MKNILQRDGPSFYKIMLFDQFVQNLRILDSFVAEHPQYLSKEVELETNLCGKIWRVKIEEKDGDFWFTEGWQKFVQDCGLKFSDLLVFRFVNGSRVQVTVFEPSGCEKEASPEEREDDGDHDDGDEEEDDDKENEEFAKMDDNIQTNEETSFTVKWKKYMRNNMPINTGFVEKNGLAKIKGVKMRNMKGDVHDVRLYHYTDRRSGFGGGWAAFIDDSDFILNETYKFEFIREHDHILVQMSLIKKKSK